jgi:uncharacterized protein involved in response to NO
VVFVFIPLDDHPKTGFARYFSNGFRPLFTACAIQAIVVMILWLIYLGRGGAVTPPGWSMIEWHGHELLFGFVGAAIGGFLLAAVSKWVGRPPVSGAPLVVLVLFWLAGRAVTWSGLDNLAALIVSNTGYWILLACLVGREILAAGNRRNFVVLVMLLVMAGFSLAFQVGLVDRIHLLESQVLVIALMISLIGGRITPAFTRNWMMRRQPVSEHKPAQFGLWDKVAVGLSVLATLAWVAQAPSMFSGGLLILAGISQWVRLARWRGFASLSEPLLFALHLGYLWVGVGFVLLGLSAFVPALTVSAGIHALGVGAMGGMILAVAARAALGHTNRELKAGVIMSMSFLAIHLAALVRILAALIPNSAMMLLMLAGTLWVVAFVLFAARYLPVLFGPEESLSEALKREKGKVGVRS